jgi:hypothetical protein
MGCTLTPTDSLAYIKAIEGRSCFLHCFPNFGINFWPILINIMFDDYMAIYVPVILYILIVVCWFVNKVCCHLWIAFLDGRLSPWAPGSMNIWVCTHGYGCCDPCWAFSNYIQLGGSHSWNKWLGIDGKSVQFVDVVCFMVFICCVMSVLVLQSCSVFEFMCLLANI